MSYNPYPPQQPQTYDPYQQQYPQGYQQPYQAPGAVTMIPYQQPPPPKTWTPLRIILVAVAIVVMLVVGFFLCAIFYIWSTPFESGPGNATPTVSMVPTAFTNPGSNQTVNGGGWSVQVLSVSGGHPLLSTISVSITRSGNAFKTLSAVSSSKSDLSYSGGVLDWYLLKGGGTMKFVDGSTVKNLDVSTSKNLNANGFPTVQGAAFIFIDADGDGDLSAADLVFVYSDIDGNGTPEVSSGDQIELSVAGSTIGACSLM